MSENKLSDIIGTSLEKIKESTDSETVVGAPISANGVTIIPVSKISMGFASGGLDYNGKNKNCSQPTKAMNFGGGGGTGVSVNPVAFLVIHPEGRVEVLPIINEAADSVEKITSIIERSPEILERLKNVFAKKKNAKETDSSAE